MKLYRSAIFFASLSNILNVVFVWLFFLKYILPELGVGPFSMHKSISSTYHRVMWRHSRHNGASFLMNRNLDYFLLSEMRNKQKNIYYLSKRFQKYLKSCTNWVWTVITNLVSYKTNLLFWYEKNRNIKELFPDSSISIFLRHQWVDVNV